MSLVLHTREFRITDYKIATKLWAEVEGVEIAEGDAKEDVVQFLARNPGLSRVAEEESTVVGVALCGHDGRRGHIYHVAISRAYQGRGLGRRLVSECLEGLRRVGIKRAIIMVAADNPYGRAFWLRSGWEEISGAVAMGIDL